MRRAVHYPGLPGKRPEKPFLLCECMHDMGNSLGGMESCIHLGEEFSMCQGGFIWDYMDQALWRINCNGEREWLWRAPRPAYWRASTENDLGNSFAAKNSIWAAADGWQVCEGGRFWPAIRKPFRSAILIPPPPYRG